MEDNEATLPLTLDPNDADDALTECQVHCCWRVLKIVFMVLVVVTFVKGLLYPDQYGIWFLLSTGGYLFSALQILEHISVPNTVVLKVFRACTILYMVSLIIFIGAVAQRQEERKTDGLISLFLKVLAACGLVLHTYVDWRADQFCW
jgi:hypothetical protein